jgi:hypothetical protein
MKVAQTNPNQNSNSSQENQQTPQSEDGSNQPQEQRDIADLLGLEEEEVKEELAKGAGSVDTKPAPASEAKPPAQVPGDGKQTGTESPAPPIPPEEEKPPAVDQESLKDVLKQVLAENKQEAPPQVQTPKEEPPFYNPVVPNEIVNALASDDANIRQQGLSVLVGGAMNKVRQDLVAVVRAEVQAAFSQVPSVFAAQQAQKSEGDKLREVFYEENPNFGGNQARMQLVAMTAIQLAQNMGPAFKGPDAAFRTSLAKTLEDMTGIKAGKVPGAPEKNPPPPKKPTYQSGGSSTRSGDSATSLQDEIWDTIGGAPN